MKRCRRSHNLQALNMEDEDCCTYLSFDMMKKCRLNEYNVVTQLSLEQHQEPRKFEQAIVDGYEIFPIETSDDIILDKEIVHANACFRSTSFMPIIYPIATQVYVHDNNPPHSSSKHLETAFFVNSKIERTKNRRRATSPTSIMKSRDSFAGTSSSDDSDENISCSR